jgi:hypothetical protein
MPFLTHNTGKQKAAGMVLMLVAIGLIVLGATRSYKAYDDDEVAKAFGIFSYQDVSDRQLTIDSTFAGVVRRDGKLFSTYNRAEGGAKRPCPT